MYRYRHPGVGSRGCRGATWALAFRWPELRRLSLGLVVGFASELPASLPLRLQMVEEGRRRRCGREDGPRTGAIMCSARELQVRGEKCSFVRKAATTSARLFTAQYEAAGRRSRRYMATWEKCGGSLG